MRAHRNKPLDWAKPFRLVDSKAVFDDLDTDNNQLVININAKAQAAQTAIHKKQDIVVPKIETVRRVTQPKKFAKVDANYIRLPESLNLPKQESYELNEVDHVFLQGHSNKFKFNGKIVLTPEFLSRAFIELEKKAGKDPTLPRNKNWMAAFVDREYKDLTTMSNYEQFTEVFYNYWKNRRQQLKFPMLRQLWRPNPDEYNHLLAFKPRQKDKRSLRRNNRLPQDQIAQQMEEEFLFAMKIVERIKFRQQLKLKQVQAQLTNFHNDCKQFFGVPNFFTQFDPESRTKDKEKLRKFQIDVEAVKKTQIQEEKQNDMQNTAATTFDQKQSIAQFLSSLVSIAESFGISYDRVFSDKAAQKPQAVVTVPLVEEPEVQDQKCDYMSMNIYRDHDTIYRTLDNDEQSNTSFVKAPKDLFEFKQREIQSYYYGSDDEGDIKDIRKNIAIGYKKYQQLKPTD